MSKLEALKTACKPFEFSVIRIDDSGEELMSAQPMTVSLESYELAEDAGSYGVDVMAKIELLQYTPYHTKSIEFKKSESSSSGTKKATVTKKRDTTTAPAGKTYTVKSGDTLWDIARVKLGNGTKWQSIYNDFVVLYESGMSIAEIAKEKKLSERTIYRYKAYYDKVMSEQKALAE